MVNSGCDGLILIFDILVSNSITFNKDKMLPFDHNIHAEFTEPLQVFYHPWVVATG